MTDAPGTDREWVRRQVEQYAKLRPRYKAYARTLAEILKHAASIYAPLAIVQSRPKAVPSFAEKIQRKKASHPPPYDPVNQFTDLCGARVITLRRADVYAMCEFIERHFDIDWDESGDKTQHLKPVEFGYRSVHYIVSFRKGVFPAKIAPAEVSEELYPDAESPMKAEIQVRTVLEHGWADLSHELSYKSAFKVPDRWEREIARVAALLEDADGAFERIHDGLRNYAASYGGFLSPEQLHREIELQRIVLEYDSDNVELARRLGKLLMTKGEWPQAVRVMEPFESTGDAQLLRDLGVSLCKMHRQEPTGEGHTRGQALLERAIEEAPEDADAVASLAGTWKGLDDNKARRLYRRAFEIDPSNPYPLGNYLTYEIARSGDTRIVSLMAPSMRQAIRRCRDQAAVNMNMPWAYYDIGKFELLLGNTNESLASYARAVQVSLSEAPIESALQTNTSLQEAVGSRLPEAEWVRRFLLVARVAKLMEMNTGGEVDPGIERKLELALKDLRDERGLATEGAQAIRGPVLIVAGGTGRGVQQRMEAYRGLLTEAFKDFAGTVISGGTTAGICGLVGELGQPRSDSITTLGYLPQDPLPDDAEIDTRYSEIRRSSGHGFTPLEPLQNWIDLIASGIAPGEVNVLGINGGEIAALEYRFALALGGRVGIVEESGREGAKLLADEEWMPSENLVKLPADPMTLRAFIGPGSPKLTSEQRELLARAIHEKYLQNRARMLRQDLTKWAKLSPEFRESSAQQADHIFEKLHEIGYEIHAVEGREPILVEFEDEEVEVMAEMEHGRWNVERLLDGWRWGPEKNVQKKISPYLVSWEELPDDIREYDREAVREIPENLAKVGLEIRKVG